MSATEDNSIEIQRRIHLGRLIGKGGMGRVVDGFAADFGQYLAVKTLNPEHADDPEMRARFEEEVAIMASIDHPGSLPVYGMTETSDGDPCYVMKKVKGRTLSDLIQQRGADIANGSTRLRLLSILLDAAETLASAHASGIVHRDIKPENILIDEEGSVFVIDWGIAKRIGPGSTSETTRTIVGQVMGSPGYMSPEQADGRADMAGPQSDVFALGAILYEILTGRRPFGTGGGREEMLGAIHHDPESPRKSNWFVPRTISAVCLKALHKDPSHRYPDARSLAADIRAHLEGLPVSALKPNSLEKLQYYARRRPFKALTLTSFALTSLALVVFIGIQVWIDQRLADKALDRLSVLENEITMIDQEVSERRQLLDSQTLSPAENAEQLREIYILDSRWILSEFEAMRILSSVNDLRFIHVDSDIAPLARQRLMEFIQGTIDRKLPSLGAAIIETIEQRHDDGILNLQLSPSDFTQLKQWQAQIEELTANPDN